MIGNQENNDKFVGLGTKISPAMAEVLNTICDAMQVDIYHLMQWFAQVLIRAAAPQHELTPEVQRLMALLESDAGWQNAFNICNPEGLEISQIVLIMEQKNKKGFGAVMINKPFMGDAKQTECVDDIVERVIEVCMKGIYRRLRGLAVEMDCHHMSDLLITMTDAQKVINIDHENAAEMQGPSNYSDYGKQIAYGKATKRKHHRTPDSLANSQQRIAFSDEDREQADEEAGRKTGEKTEFRPFDQEW